MNIQFHCWGWNGTSISSVARRDEPLSDLFTWFASPEPVKMFSFSFEGKRLAGTETPDSLQIVSDCLVIDAVRATAAKPTAAKPTAAKPTDAPSPASQRRDMFAQAAAKRAEEEKAQAAAKVAEEEKAQAAAKVAEEEKARLRREKKELRAKKRAIQKKTGRKFSKNSPRVETVPMDQAALDEAVPAETVLEDTQMDDLNRLKRDIGEVQEPSEHVKPPKPMPWNAKASAAGAAASPPEVNPAAKFPPKEVITEDPPATKVSSPPEVNPAAKFPPKEVITEDPPATKVSTGTPTSLVTASLTPKVTATVEPAAKSPPKEVIMGDEGQHLKREADDNSEHETPSPKKRGGDGGSGFIDRAAKSLAAVVGAGSAAVAGAGSAAIGAIDRMEKANAKVEYLQSRSVIGIDLEAIDDVSAISTEFEEEVTEKKEEAKAADKDAEKKEEAKAADKMRKERGSQCRATEFEADNEEFNTQPGLCLQEHLPWKFGSGNTNEATTDEATALMPPPQPVTRRQKASSVSKESVAKKPTAAKTRRAAAAKKPTAATRVTRRSKESSSAASVGSVESETGSIAARLKDRRKKNN